jgi:hypothetical protein
LSISLPSGCWAEKDGCQPQRALNQQNAQDQNIRGRGGGANSRVGQAAHQQADTATRVSTPQMPPRIMAISCFWDIGRNHE